MKKIGPLRILGIIPYLVLCLLLSPTAHANEPVLLNGEQPRVNIYPHLSFYVDPSRQLDIQHIVATPASISWAKSENKTPNFG